MFGVVQVGGGLVCPVVWAVWFGWVGLLDSLVADQVGEGEVPPVIRGTG